MTSVSPNQLQAIASQFLPGHVYRATHQTAVDTILSPLGLRRKVYSRGDQFFNHDRWTLRIFTLRMCEWVEDHPYQRPTRSDVQKWVDSANTWDLIDVHRRDEQKKKEEEDDDGTRRRRSKPSEPFIQIPATPNQLSKFLADALRGGAYHEALHTACDLRDDMTIDEVWPYIQQNWDLVPNWGQFAETLLYWENELSDVKNEQWGCREYEGIARYLHTVHDNRIFREIESIEKLKRAGIYIPNRHSFTVKIFRHFAFDYDTPVQRKAINFYYEEVPEVVAFCKHGPFRALIEEAKLQWEHGRMSSLDLGMRMVGAVFEAAFAYPDNIMGDVLGKVKHMESWGHCRIHPSMSAVAGAILGDIDKNPQHQGTMEAIRIAIENYMSQNAMRSPMNYEYDTVEIAKGTGAGIDKDRQEAVRRTQEVRRDIAYYRSKLRTLVKAQELTGVRHGVEDGIDISDEMLVDTLVSLRAGEYPTEAFYDIDEQIDTSTAVYVLGDQSSSMWSNIREACKVILSILDPLHSLQVKTMASGFYSTNGDQKDMDDYWEANERGYWSSRKNEEGMTEKEREHIRKRFSRPWGVHHTVYKLWDEDYQRVRWRFANYVSDGGTPMADGIQFALNALQTRREGHRILFVVTDGMPDPGTEDEIKTLLDLAHEAGIVVVGVGFGGSAQYVKTLFRESVWDSTIQGLPHRLIKKLNQLMNFRGEGPRGKKLSRSVVEPRRRAG